MATDSKSKPGEFKRPDTDFQNWVRAEPSSEAGDFPAEGGHRYWLYASYACPWAHRCMLVRALKGLEDAVKLIVVDPVMDTDMTNPVEYKGWPFSADVCEEPHGFSHIGEVYELSNPGFRESFISQTPPRKPYYAVPVLFDSKTNKIVCNESSKIIHMFNSEFNAFATNPGLDLAPASKEDAMKAIDDVVYPSLNNGVYRVGFARSQEAYDDALDKLEAGLAEMEAVLAEKRYLTGGTLTLSDVRLWVTLIRYDQVYATHFSCNSVLIRDLPNLTGFTRELYQMPAFKSTTFFDHIKNHYYRSHPWLRPLKIVARGPALDFDKPHNRDHLPKDD